MYNTENLKTQNIKQFFLLLKCVASKQKQENI